MYNTYSCSNRHKIAYICSLNISAHADKFILMDICVLLKILMVSTNFPDNPRINTLIQKLNGTKDTSTDEKTVFNSYVNDLCLKLYVGVKERQDKLPTIYWLPKLHKRPYQAKFITNSSSCTSTELSKLLTSCLTAVKFRVIGYYETIYERSRKIMSINNSARYLVHVT